MSVGSASSTSANGGITPSKRLCGGMIGPYFDTVALAGAGPAEATAAITFRPLVNKCGGPAWWNSFFGYAPDSTI